jgi:hypothetical protein
MNLADQTPRSGASRAAKPWQSRTEYLVDQALTAWATDEEALRHLSPEGVPPRPLFPERTGFRKVEPGVMDILNIDRYQPSNRSWVSGFPIEYRNGERVYTQGEQAGSTQASSRNSMGPLWV